jgi:hypothetical protein
MKFGILEPHWRIAKTRHVELFGGLDKKARYDTQKTKIWQDKTKQDKTKQDKTRQHKTKQHKTKQDKTRQDKTRQDKTRWDETRQDETRQDTVNTRQQQENNKKTTRTQQDQSRTPETFRGCNVIRVVVMVAAKGPWALLDQTNGAGTQLLVGFCKHNVLPLQVVVHRDILPLQVFVRQDRGRGGGGGGGGRGEESIDRERMACRKSVEKGQLVPMRHRAVVLIDNDFMEQES